MSDYKRKRTMQKRARHRRARYRVRSRVVGSADCPRLSVHKSLKYIYAQLIDDAAGVTLAQASSRESAVASKLESGSGNRQAAKAVGECIAERAKEKGVSRVVFDRGGNIYHGKVKALAEGAREGGLVF